MHMPRNEPEPSLIRFGVFELNSAAGELRRNGIRLKLGEQPLRILQCLAERPGEIVTREELQRLLWGEAAFVDAEHGLNAAINKLRESLADSAATPRYIETVPRRGYRFLAEVTRPVATKPAEDPVATPPPPDPPPPVPVAKKRSNTKRFVAAAVLLVVGLAAGAWWARSRPGVTPPQFVMRPLTADSGLTTQPALSRDGQLVVYASDRATSNNLDIWVHPRAPGGQPIRLTHHEADDYFPDISPDGGLVAFRSERDGGGIYLVPALGGEERLLVRGGRFPRFAPDGKSVAYCVGFTYETPSAIYTVPVGGGTPKQLAADVPWACKPVFSPDGQYILFDGALAQNDPRHDWWVAPVAGGHSVQTGAFAILTAQLDIPSIVTPGLPDLSADRCLFTLSGQIWELDLAGPNWKAIGPARPLTSGSVHQFVRAGAGSTMVFVNSRYTLHLWKLDVDHNKGKVLGEMQPLPTTAGGNQAVPTASSDGRLLAFTQFEPAGPSIRLRNLLTSKESTLVAANGRPHLSPDGTRLAYSVLPDSLFVMPSGGGEVIRLISPEQKLSLQAFGWTPDGRKIVYWHGKPIRYALFDPETRQSSDFLSHARYPIHTAQISPDQRWVAFNTPTGKENPLWIAPFRNEKAAEEKDWIRVSEHNDFRPWWSPDGNLLYMVSRRDGALCIWMQPLDPVSKQPNGNASALLHVHDTRKRLPGGMAAFGPAILPGGLIFPLEEESGNVWLAQPQTQSTY
ncbi:MAG: PD40 domain-containing protein [Bryobacterales bacterium]|nr:PD40 domain-containing protein [Bryobacterales bacterium]